MSHSDGMKQPEIFLLVNDYLGGEGGYLWGFSYTEHDEFYPHFCNLNLDASAARRKYGTTRKAFIGVLRDSPPDVQARIIDGVLDKFPIDAFPETDRDRKRRVRGQMEAIASRLRGGPAVEVDDLKVQSDAVSRAIADAATLIRDRSAASGVDRVHTTLHGYLKAIVKQERLTAGADPSMTDLMKVLRQQHPAFQDSGPRSQDLSTILKAIGAILGSLDPIRNRASGAHPNEVVLHEPEALLAIDAARTVLNYLDRKLRVG
jgi:DNA-binding FrmR family transcriptional regulator